MTPQLGAVTAATLTNPRLIAGFDEGLNTGALVVLDRHARDHAGRVRVVEAVDLSEASAAPKQARAEARELAKTFIGVHDIEFCAAHLRAEAYTRRLTDALDGVAAEYGVEVSIIALESFDDQAQHAKVMKKGRWKTPLAIGMAAGELVRRGYRLDNGRLVYQNAGVVLKQNEDEIKRLADRRTKTLDVVRPGDHLITNGHKRSAFAHALALSTRLDEAHPLTTLHHATAA